MLHNKKYKHKLNDYYFFSISSLFFALSWVIYYSFISFFYIVKQSVLIDDRESLREAWENAGGIFIHHIDTKTTIQKLKEYGIL